MVTIHSLPEHSRVYTDLKSYFSSFSFVTGIFLSGSGAADTMDQYSDIDMGIVFESTKNLEKFWEQRWDWELPSWFHRFDADHVKEHFIIILFEPDIKVDLALYTKDSLPPPEGAPFLLDYYKEEDLKTWCENSNRPLQEKQKKPEMNLAEIIHDDERV